MFFLTVGKSFFFQLIPVLPLVDKASRWVDASSGKDGGVTRFGSF